MTPLNKIVAVTSQGGYTTTAHGGQRITATASSYSGGTGNSTFSAYGNSQYNYYMSSLLPATPEIADNAGLLYFYRDIYLHDNTAGSCVDIMSTFPFSDFEIRGLEGRYLKIFNDALSRLNVPGLMPQTSVSTLVDGFTASTLIYDAQAKNFMDVLTYDSMSCSVIPSPLHNLDPAITVSVGGQLQQFVEQAGDYAQEYLNRMPASFVELLKSGTFRLDPVTTLFFGRKTLSDRAYVSYLHRILPMYLIEKTMYRGTLTEANRRQRAMSQITAGDDLWTPTDEELLALVKQFQLAEQDPMGGWIGTRNSVSVNDLRPAGEFWKWTDMSDQMTTYKLRALGISEAFLSGDASYSSSEAAFSAFLETMNSWRSRQTYAMFDRKILPLVAVANGLYKDPTRKPKSVADFLFNSSDRGNLMLPTIHWHKDLTADTEDNMMDMLERLAEKTNAPIPIKTWAAAAGIDIETLVRDAESDEELRKRLKIGNGGGDDGGGSGAGSGSGEEEFEDATPSEASFRGASTLPFSVVKGHNKRSLGLFNRRFSEDDTTGRDSQGRRTLAVNANAKRRDAHYNIVKAALKAKDPMERARMRKANIDRFGAATVDL
jgi:hypothetical protein